MKVKINISKKEKEHIKSCDSYLDCCGTLQNVFRKVKVELKKKEKK